MNSSTQWVTQAEMNQVRKDHACVEVEIDGVRGILVTGGVDAEETLLKSAEFYSIEDEEWQSLRDMKTGRTEHGVSF